MSNKCNHEFKQHDGSWGFQIGTCVHCEMDVTEEVLEYIVSLKADIARLREALIISRGQWIHSVNKEKCLKALEKTK